MELDNRRANIWSPIDYVAFLVDQGLNVRIIRGQGNWYRSTKRMMGHTQGTECPVK